MYIRLKHEKTIDIGYVFITSLLKPVCVCGKLMQWISGIYYLIVTNNTYITNTLLTFSPDTPWLQDNGWPFSGV